ncbi:MAG TPA: Uma2 family endonuclease [Polyangia bacterium]|jgi:Uma2 family endonuclease
MGHFLHDSLRPGWAPGWGRKPPLPEFRHAPITYPEEDGVPLGETEFHVRAILHLFAALDQHLRGRQDAYVGADLLVYYEEGDPAKVIVPDVFVALGARRGPRRIFELWEEQAGPTVVIEVTSKSSRLEDLGAKKVLYEQIGVSEYYLFDPLGEYLTPRLQGFRRAGDQLAAVGPLDGGTFDSPALGLELVPAEELLRLRDRKTGALLRTLDEEARQAEEETRRAERAEAEVARLRAELERLRRGQ